MSRGQQVRAAYALFRFVRVVGLNRVRVATALFGFFRATGFSRRRSFRKAWRMVMGTQVEA